MKRKCIIPFKPESDSSEYRHITLENALCVLLISDPSTDKASACMDVKVGHLHNPPELPGLAHFLEHMLFLGNEKYPVENGYQNFVQEHGGMTNAYTTSEDTNYYFDISHEFLEPALDRFAQFFIAPTFTESATFREIQAVDSEYRNGKSQDSHRLNHFNHLICNPHHPFNRFEIGSIESLRERPEKLGIDLRKALLDFHKKYYSANVMKLVVLGRESLDTLEELVIKIFSTIKNENISPLFPGCHEVPLFTKEQLPCWHNIVPNSDAHHLRLYWPIPSLHSKFSEKPDRYLAHLLGHEADGSLFALLKRYGWVLQLVAGTLFRLSDYDLFSCTISLTTKGLNYIEDIICLVFQYLNLLKTKGVQKWIFDEIKISGDIEFRFSEKQKPAKHTSYLANCMQLYEPQYILYGPHYFEKFDPDLIKNVLDQLSPQNLIAQVISKVFSGKTTEKDEWYGCEYSSIPFPQNLLEKLSNVGLSNELYLPLPNEFLPSDFTLKTGAVQLSPEIILDIPQFTLWHKLDSTFRKPKAHFLLQLISPEGYSSPQNSVLTSLFAKLCQDSLNEKYTYYADIAGLTFALASSFEGLLLEVTGYNEKISVLVKKIFQRLINLEVKEERFHVLQEQSIRNYENLRLSQPYERASELLKNTLSHIVWTTEQKLEVIKTLTFHDLKDFIVRLLKQAKLRALFQGNFSKEDSLQLVSDIQGILNSKTFFHSQIPLKRILKLPEGVHVLHQSKVFNLQDVNSCNWDLFQIGQRNIRDDVLLELLCQIIQVPFFEQLRTQEQLGYGVWTLNTYEGNVSNFCCVIQSPKKDPIFIHHRVATFLQHFKETITQMPDEDFKKHIDALISTKLQKFTMLGQEIRKNWEEIISYCFKFDRNEIYAKELLTIKKQDLLEFYESKILNKKTRKLISFQVFGGQTSFAPTSTLINPPQTKTGDLPSPTNSNQNNEEKMYIISIDTEQQFKNQLFVYPACPSEIFPKL